MFDIGFWELCLVGLISLLVIGPERLPKVARITGYWLGKTRSMVASVKQEIRDELREEEIRQLLKERSGMDDVQQLVDDASKAGDSVRSATEKLSDEVDAIKQTGRNDLK